MKHFLKSHFIFCIILLLSFVGVYYIMRFYIHSEFTHELSYETFVNHVQNGTFNLWITTVILPFIIYIISYGYHHWYLSVNKTFPPERKPLLISFSEEMEVNKDIKLFLFLIVFILLWSIFLYFLFFVNIVLAILLLPVLLQFVQVIYHWIVHRLSFIYSIKHVKSIIHLLLISLFWGTLLFYSIDQLLLLFISIYLYFLPFLWIPFHYCLAMKTGKYLVLLENAFNKKVRHKT